MLGIDQVMNKLKKSKKDETETKEDPKENKEEKATKVKPKEEPATIEEPEPVEEAEEQDEEEVDEPEEVAEPEEEPEPEGEGSEVEAEEEDGYMDLTEDPKTKKEKLLVKMAKEREALQNDGTFRAELLYRFNTLNKNLTILNGLIMKALDLNKGEEDIHESAD